MRQILKKILERFDYLTQVSPNLVSSSLRFSILGRFGGKTLACVLSTRLLILLIRITSLYLSLLWSASHVHVSVLFDITTFTIFSRLLHLDQTKFFCFYVCLLTAAGGMTLVAGIPIPYRGIFAT